MSFPRIHPTLSRVSETATRYITAKTPSAEARQEKLEAAARQLLARTATKPAGQNLTGYRYTIASVKPGDAWEPATVTFKA